MNLIFKLNGSDFLRENDPTIIPHVGWKIKFNSKAYEVVSIELDYDIPKTDETLIIHLKNESELRSEFKQVKIVKVWKQNKNSLTLHKVYDIIAENNGYFSINDDKGVIKKYQNDNYQFRHI